MGSSQENISFHTVMDMFENDRGMSSDIFEKDDYEVDIQSLIPKKYLQQLSYLEPSILDCFQDYDFQLDFDSGIYTVPNDDTLSDI
ncbi:hypothetical protein SS50377_26425 [Spironucleus salmonicida]|uniref:Uncharacterized protein n=1 Tax=Spironucleus salmonicida TaxID=348837 RepID=V6LU05_9EUKA|nr:hypothetical protein SS50377_28805 [Spironucleus salmonicida]KAH0572216.1 hypothetical protein SS50377_26425 [Spironucleus salmonicida]|eukprot:EST47708.1 Hypothetical protein SS50377_12104 [Spironucleus salmonicida]